MADIKEQAIAKLKDEFNNIKKLSRKGEVVSEPVLNALTAFCRQSGEFAQAIVQKEGKNLKDCVEYTVAEAEGAISDIDVYSRAAAYYFDEAKVSFTMSIDIGSETPGDSAEAVEKRGLDISLDDLL